MKHLTLLSLCFLLLFSCKKKEEIKIVPPPPIDTVLKTAVDSFAGNYDCLYLATSIIHRYEPAPESGTFYDTSDKGYKSINIKRTAQDSFTINGISDELSKRNFYFEEKYSFSGELYYHTGINIQYLSQNDSVFILINTYQGGGGGNVVYNTYYMGKRRK